MADRNLKSITFPGLPDRYVIKGDGESIAAEYSASSTYAVGEYVMYNNALYRCTTAITTAEAWTAAHWTAAKIGEDLTDCSRQLSDLAEDGKYEDELTLTVDDLVQGVWNSNSIPEIIGYRVRSKGAFSFTTGDKITVTVGSGFKVTVNCYGSEPDGATEQTWIYTTGWKTSDFVLTADRQEWVIINIGKTDDSNVTPSEVDASCMFVVPGMIKMHAEIRLDEVDLEINALNSDVYNIGKYGIYKEPADLNVNDFVQGVWNAGVIEPVTYRVRSIDSFILNKGESISASIGTGYKLTINVYESELDGITTQPVYQMTGWQSANAVYTAPKDVWAIINIGKTDDSVIIPEEAGANVTVTVPNSKTHAEKRIDNLENEIESIVDVGTDYIQGVDFVKRRVNVVKIGELAEEQSFFVYNNKYYSTYGSSVAIQDSNFNLISETPMQLGHGNAFQLGHNGKAYASGWDDQKIYIVDVSSDPPVLSDSITLPTTGYTTCAVDDINQIAYIFQRDSYPDTEDYYNFIVYDYANENVIITKKITVPMAGMQAVDFVDDKIYVLNGLGSVAAPNGYRVFDTAGNLLYEYKIASLAGEPEGVFVDRTTKEMLISFINSYVYKVSIVT